MKSWGPRILMLMMLLAFLLLMLNLHKQLLRLQQERGGSPSTATSTP